MSATAAMPKPAADSAIAFACPVCAAAYRVPAHLGERPARCRQCHAALLVPATSDAVAAQPAPTTPAAKGATAGSTTGAPGRATRPLNIFALLGALSLVLTAVLPVVTTPGGLGVSLSGIGANLEALGVQADAPLPLLFLLWGVPGLGVLAFLREFLTRRRLEPPRGTFFLAALLPLVLIGVATYTFATASLTVISADATGAPTLAALVRDAVDAAGGADAGSKNALREGFQAIKPHLGAGVFTLLGGVFACLLAVLISPGGKQAEAAKP